MGQTPVTSDDFLQTMADPAFTSEMRHALDAGAVMDLWVDVQERLEGQPMLRARFQQLLQAFDSATQDLMEFIYRDVGAGHRDRPRGGPVKLPRLQLVPPDDAPDGPRLRVAGFDQVPANPREQDA